MTDPGKSAVCKKISTLMRVENKPQRQAVATALSMQRAGRLTSGGDYIRKQTRKIGRMARGR